MSSTAHQQQNCAPFIDGERLYIPFSSSDVDGVLTGLKSLPISEVQEREVWLDWRGTDCVHRAFDVLRQGLSDQFCITVAGVRVERDAAEVSLNRMLGAAVEVKRPHINAARRTAHVKRTIRSGRSLRFDGDVVLMGDVNPGAHIAATGNIVILGALKGTAHAGANGDDDSHVMALSLTPIQVRIGRRIAVSPPVSRLNAEPQVASVQSGQITFEPYRRFISR